jgi:hypothetical protein
MDDTTLESVHVRVCQLSLDLRWRWFLGFSVKKTTRDRRSEEKVMAIAAAEKMKL